MASSEASESNYLDVLLKGEQIIQAVMRKSIDSEKSSTPSKRRYGLRSRAETILEATQSVLNDFSNKSDSIQDEHLNAAVKCLQLMAGAQKAGLTSFTPKFVSEFLEDQTEKIVAILEKLDENRVLKFGLQFWAAHLQVVLTMTKHLTPEILVRACHPVAEWIKQFAFDAKTEVYKETVRLSEQVKNSDLEEDCKTATLGALEVSDMVPLNVSKKFPSPSKILAPTNFSALFKSPAQQSQSSSQPVRTTRRSSVKRPVALVDEDSVDYVPIASKNTGSARKKAKLTEHQKEKFAEKKDKLPFMDEDSQSCQNLIGVLATDFDFESSSQSASTQGQKKEEGNPGQEAREKEKNDNENGNQEVGKVVEPESAIEDNKRKTNVKLDFEQESPAIADEPNLDKESDGEEEIQKMDVDVNDVVPVTSEVAEESGPVPTLEERLVETSLKDPETPKEENEAENTPQKFATPEKEVVTPTHSPSAAHLASKRKSRTPTRHQARPKWTIMDSIAKIKHDKKKAEIAQVLPPPVPARLTPVESPKAEKSEEKEESEKIKTEENVENAEIPEQDQDQENQSQTLETKTPPRVVIEPVKPTVGTPSILKKPGTPMNSEKKKYRVHFHSPDKADVSTSDEVQSQSQETSVSTTTMTLHQNDENQTEIQHLDKDLESGGKKAEEDEEPIFSELIDCDQPVTSVIPRLIPHGHSSTSQVMLRKTLASQGVKTVGDLARMRPRQISKLNIKKPRMETAKTVLKEYFEEKEKERKLAQERILEMEKRRKEEEEADTLRLTQERENQDKQGETELENGNEKENEQADDSIVPDSNESSKDKASFIEHNCEDDDELEMSQVLGVPEEIPDEECENRRVVLPVVCKMPEIPSERNEYSRMNDQDHEQERIVILDDEVDEYDSDKENQKTDDDDGEKDDKLIRSIHNTPQSTNCDGRGGQTVSPQFSPIKKLHGILTELTDETGDNLDEEFNIQKEPLKLDHSVGQKVLEAQKDECEVPEVMNKSFDEDMTVDELEEMPQKEAEAKNDIGQAIRALHSLPDACGKILNALQSLTEEQMGGLKGTLSDAILPFNELIAKVALSK